MPQDPFAHDTYLVRRKVFKLFGAALHIYAADGSLAFYSKQKAFKLKEDIRLFADESMTKELLSIQAQQIIDFSAAYLVTDPVQNETVGTFRRKGFKSLLQDEWEIIDEFGQVIGHIREEDAGMAAVRRFIELASLLFPQRHHIDVGGEIVGHLQQSRNPFVFKLAADFSADANQYLDRRLRIAAAVLMALIEGRQG